MPHAAPLRVHRAWRETDERSIDASDVGGAIDWTLYEPGNVGGDPGATIFASASKIAPA